MSHVVKSGTEPFTLWDLMLIPVSVRTELQDTQLVSAKNWRIAWCGGKNPTNLASQLFRVKENSFPSESWIWGQVRQPRTARYFLLPSKSRYLQDVFKQKALKTKQRKKQPHDHSRKPKWSLQTALIFKHGLPDWALIISERYKVPCWSEKIFQHLQTQFSPN